MSTNIYLIMQIILNREQRSQIKSATLVLIMACICPLLVHLAPPFNDIPMGALLLPMFYIPFIALFFFSLPVALAGATLAPLINFIFTGNPHWEIVIILSMELVLFTIIANKILSTRIKWVAAPVSYFLVKVISSLFLFFVALLPVSSWDFFLSSLSIGAPGILVLALVNFTLLLYKSNFR